MNKSQARIIYVSGLSALVLSIFIDCAMLFGLGIGYLTCGIIEIIHITMKSKKHKPEPEPEVPTPPEDKFKPDYVKLIEK